MSRLSQALVMLGSSVALGLLLISPADTTSNPRHVVTLAFRATEEGRGDSLSRNWELRVRRDSSDRTALFGLATLARLRYDYGTAERLYRVLRRDSTSPDAVALYAQLGLAQGFDAQGLSAQATTELIRARAAAREAGDSAVEGEALLGLSLQRAFTEGIEAGLATLDTVARLVPAEAYELHAERLRQRAALRGIIGRPEARADADSALAVARKTGLNRLAGQALRSTAQVLQFEGKRDSSIALLRQAEELYRRGRDRAQLSSALLWHVNALLGQGDLSQANDLAHLARREGEAAHNRFSVASAYTTLGAISIFLSDFAAASDYLDRSIEMFEQVGDSAGAMKARDYLAVTALAAGDAEGARRLTLEVLQWYRRTGEAQIELSAHRNLAIIAMHQGNWDAAEQSLGDAHALARRLGRPLWSAELAYDDARLALFRGNLPAAERRLTRYLATLDSTQHVLRHDVRVRLADVYARRGEPGRAKREARQAWDELERWRATLSEQELRVLAFQTSPTEMSDRDASVVRVLAGLAQGGETEEVFELAERRRARELADRLLQARTLQSHGPAELRDTSLRSGARVDADEVARLMPDSTALLEYVTGSLGAPTTLLVVTRDPGGVRVRGYSLPAADSLKLPIARFAALIQNGSPSNDLARTLGDALLGPAVVDLGASVRRLIIVPDGPVHRVPFDALRLPDSRYVAERYAVSLAPSAGVLTALWRRPRSGSERRMRLLAFGDPNFPAADETRAGGYQRLPSSGREARLVARYSPASVVRVRGDASEGFLKRSSLDAFRVLHFATHTVVDEQTAARTALLLSPGKGENGLVGPAEVAALDLDADLVVLSSCRSAGGVIVQGEGVQGLTAPLLQAGARSVVATQWEVGDRSTVRLIESLYRNLAGGESVGDALHRAKLEVLHRGAPPREWAAFVTVGNPAVNVPLRLPPRSGTWPAVLVASVLTVCLVAAYLLIRRRRTRE